MDKKNSVDENELKKAYFKLKIEKDKKKVKDNNGITNSNNNDQISKIKYNIR